MGNDWYLFGFLEDDILKQINLLISLAVLAVLCISYPAQAQTCPRCGDSNDDGIVSISDITYLISYFFAGGSPPSPCANVDGCGGVTTADLVRMDRFYRYSTPVFLDCNDTTSCSTIVGGEVRVESYLTVQYPGSDSISVPIYIKTIAGVTGLSLGFHSASALAPITSIDFTGSQVATDFVLSECKPADGKVLIVAGLAGQTPPVYNHALLCRLNIRILSNYPPIPSLPDSSFVTPGGEWRFVTDQLPYLRPAFVGYTCTACGDANSDMTIDITDIIYLIRFIFVGGETPGFCNYPLGKGDGNGDGRVDISDPVYLLTRIFSGGFAPHCYGM
jgi:hypothetical protein